MADVPDRGFAFSDQVSEVRTDDEPSDRATWIVPASGSTRLLRVPRAGGRELVRRLEDLGRAFTPEGALATANQLGWLVSPLPVWTVQLSDSWENSPRVFRGGLRGLGERLDLWVNEALRFYALRRLWRAVVALESPSAAPSSASVRDVVNRAVNRSRGSLTYEIAATSGAYRYAEPRVMNDPTVLRRIPSGDAVAAASYVVCHEVNRSLEGQLDLVVLPFSNREARQVPRNLLASAYLAFAVELSGRAPRRPCGYSRCSELIDGRRNKRYCKPSHRAAAAYERLHPEPKPEVEE